MPRFASGNLTFYSEYVKKETAAGFGAEVWKGGPELADIDIKSVADHAAALIRAGRPFGVAVQKAMKRYGVGKDPIEFDAIFREVCSDLGKRGDKRKKKLAAVRQMSLPLRFPQ